MRYGLRGLPPGSPSQGTHLEAETSSQQADGLVVGCLGLGTLCLAVSWMALQLQHAFERLVGLCLAQAKIFSYLFFH